MNPLNFPVILLDLDDTLITTRATYGWAQCEAIQKVLAFESKARIQELCSEVAWLCQRIGSGNHQFYFEALLNSAGYQGDKASGLCQALVERYEQGFWANLRPFDGATEFLSLAKDRGIHLALVSNGKVKNQNAKLKQTGLDVFFPKANRFISEAFEPFGKKPFPKLVQKALDPLSIEPNQALFVGNTIEDILAGNLAGVSTAFFGEKPNPLPPSKLARANFWLKDWSDPVRLIKAT